MNRLGRAFLRGLAALGEIGALLWETLGFVLRGQHRPRLTSEQLVRIGFGSQVVVIVTGAFTGAVFTAQTLYQAERVGLETGVGGLVSIGLCRELAPVLVGLMVTGRVGAAMTAELGSMKVTEQIDALRAMGVRPTGYLVVPRFLAILVSMPLLIAEAILFGIIATYVVGVHLYGVEGSWFYTHLKDYTALEDIAFGMIKGFVFGILICLIACHQGLNARDGATGVGRATTKAVVIASLAVLITNFFLTILLTYVFPYGE